MSGSPRRVWLAPLRRTTRPDMGLGRVSSGFPFGTLTAPPPYIQRGVGGAAEPAIQPPSPACHMASLRFAYVGCSLHLCRSHLSPGQARLDPRRRDPDRPTGAEAALFGKPTQSRRGRKLLFRDSP